MFIFTDVSTTYSFPLHCITLELQPATCSSALKKAGDHSWPGTTSGPGYLLARDYFWPGITPGPGLLLAHDTGSLI